MSTHLVTRCTALDEAETAVERRNVDRTRTAVEFEVDHLWGLHTVRGRFCSFDGDVHRRPAQLADQADDRRRKRRHRRRRSATSTSGPPDFFAAAQHPQVRLHVDADHRPGKRTRARAAEQLEAAGTSIPTRSSTRRCA